MVVNHQNMVCAHMLYIHNNSHTIISSLQHCIYHEYIQHNISTSLAYANRKTKANSHYRFFTIIYTAYTLTISNLITTDFNNPQMAFVSDSVNRDISSVGRTQASLYNWIVY